MLTSKDQTRISEAVVTDVNANVERKGGGRQVVSPEAALLFNKSIVGKPLMVPEVCSIHIKNMEYRYRWVNFQGQHGQIYMQRRAMGFTNATAEDVDILGGDAVSTGGEIRAGDLILMKIPTERYDAAIKYNMEKALLLSRMRGVTMEGASTDIWAEDNPKRASISNEPFARDTAKPFIPDNPDSIIDDSISSGRADKTRQIQKEMREKHSKE